MSKPFPDLPAYSGANAPSRIEADVFDLEIEGEIPADLRGSWYRVGPDNLYPPFLDQDYFINGDGMVSMFRIGNGTVDLKTRFVRTERFEAQRIARRALFGRYRNRHTDDPSVAGIGRGTANTTMVWHAGHLLALKEDSRPIKIDPDTLATLGEWSWGDSLRARTFTAHPKVDPVSGEMLFFCNEAEGDGSSAMAFCVVDRDGSLIREEWFEPPYVSLVHDFAVSERHVVFPIFPAVMEPERFKAGGQHWMWDGSKQTHIGIMPRNGSVADMRWFKRPACFAFHIINAFDDGNRVVVDLIVSDRIAFPFVGDVTGAPFDPARAASRPTRWVFDMDSNADGFTEEVLCPFTGELPRIDDRRMMRDYRYAYMPSFDFLKPMHRSPTGGPSWNVLAQLDVQTRSGSNWHGGEHVVFEEAQFVSVPSRTAAEDGYVMTVAQNLEKNSCELLIFEAMRIADGPIARARAPFRMKMATHTTWVSETERMPGI